MREAVLGCFVVSAGLSSAAQPRSLDQEATRIGRPHALGTGPTRERVTEGNRRALMPWVVLAALVPLGFLLLRRNV